MLLEEPTTPLDESVIDDEFETHSDSETVSECPSSDPALSPSSNTIKRNELRKRSRGGIWLGGLSKSRALRSGLYFLLLGLVVFFIGFAVRRFLDFPLVSTVTLLIGASLVLFGLVMILFHLPLWLCHTKNWFSGSSFLHYCTELESYLTMGLTTCIIIAFIYFQTFFAELENLRNAILSVLGCLLSACILLALKKHWLVNLAISHNYSMYAERVHQAVTFDRLLWMYLELGKKRKRKQLYTHVEIAPMINLEGFITEDRQHGFPSNIQLTTSPLISQAAKKRHFVAFARLAHRTLASLDSEKQNRKWAGMKAEKLFRRTRTDLRRDYLLGADFQKLGGTLQDARHFVSLLSNGQKSVNILSFREVELAQIIEEKQRDCLALAKSMQSIEQALLKIDYLLTILVLLLLFILVAIVMGDAVQLLLAMSTLLSGAAFVFGSSAKNFFESVVFLLVLHPFDIGDRLWIALQTSSDLMDNLIVLEMHLMSTVMERWDGVRVHVPNYVLASKPIINVRRSGAMFDTQKIALNFDLRREVIEILGQRLTAYINAHPSDWQPDPCRLVIDSLEPSTNRLWLTMVVRQASNFQDWQLQLDRRSKLLEAFRGWCHELGVEYRPPVQRIELNQQQSPSTSHLLNS